MTPIEAGQRILDTMLGHLGFIATIETSDGPGGPSLQIATNQDEFIIGREGQ